MKTYQFDVILKDMSEITEADADRLFDAGCDDGTLVSSGGAAWIHFDREAASLEEAIRSAVAQVQSTGLAVTTVELDMEAAASLGEKRSRFLGAPQVGCKRFVKNATASPPLVACFGATFRGLAVRSRADSRMAITRRCSCARGTGSA